MVKVYSHTKLTYNDFWKTLFEKTAKKKERNNYKELREDATKYFTYNH